MSNPGKLLSINNYHYRRGGAEVVYFNHAALFSELGWDTAFFAMHHPKNRDSAQQEFFVDEVELGREKGFLRKLVLAPKIVYSLEARRKLGALLDNFSADIAHIHSVYHHISPSVLSLLKQRGVPVVLTAHDLKLLCPAYTMLSNGKVCEDCLGGKTWNVTRKRCIKGSTALSLLVGIEAFVHGLLKSYGDNVAKIIAPSQFYRDKFVEWGWPEQQLQYIPNYVESGQFTPDFNAGSYFLYFGRLVRDKGVQTLIAASANAGTKLKIAGTGPADTEFRRLAEKLGADVEFLGFRSGQALHKLIAGARAVVLPSEWYENSPVSLLEAYALGKPVIGADIGGIPEMITAETGWLFTSGNTAELAQCLDAVDTLPSGQIAAMGSAARDLVEQRYTSAGYLHAMQGIYAELSN